MVHVVLTIPKPSVWSMENGVNAFPRSIEKEQIRLRTVIHSMLGLITAWFLNAMGPDLLINIVTNFIWSYLHQFFNNSHGHKGYGKPSKRPFNRCQSRLEAINIG